MQSTVVTLDDFTIDRIARQTVKLLRESPTPIAVDNEEAMKLMGLASKSAFYRECRDLGLVPYRPGRYRVRDIENAIAKKAYRAREKAGIRN